MLISLKEWFIQPEQVRIFHFFIVWERTPLWHMCLLNCLLVWKTNTMWELFSSTYLVTLSRDKSWWENWKRTSWKGIKLQNTVMSSFHVLLVSCSSGGSRCRTWLSWVNKLLCRRWEWINVNELEYIYSCQQGYNQSCGCLSQDLSSAARGVFLCFYPRTVLVDFIVWIFSNTGIELSEEDSRCHFNGMLNSFDFRSNDGCGRC